MGKKKLGVSNTPYDGSRWVTDGGWWVTDGGWWVATKHQRVDAIAKKKKGERPYGTPCLVVKGCTVHSQLKAINPYWAVVLSLNQTQKKRILALIHARVAPETVNLKNVPDPLTQASTCIGRGGGGGGRGFWGGGGLDPGEGGGGGHEQQQVPKIAG